MTDKERYQQKLQTQLREWEADLGNLKAKTSKATGDARQAMQRQVDALEPRIREGKKRLSELSGASEEAWETMKDGLETAWGSLSTAFKEAAHKFKDHGATPPKPTAKP